MSDLSKIPSRLDPAGISPLEQRIVDKSESPKLQQVKSEVHDYVQHHLDKTVEKPESYNLSQLKLNGKIPGTTAVAGEKPTTPMQDSMPLVKDLTSEHAKRLALAKGA